MIINFGSCGWRDLREAFEGWTNLQYFAIGDSNALSQVCELRETFKDCSHPNFNPDSSNWNTESVTTMEKMFTYATHVNQIHNI